MKTELWTKQSTVKVLKDKSYGGEFRRSLPLTVKMAKGEYESVQLIMTAKENVQSYVVAVSELSDGKGNVIKSENIQVYNVKYIEVAEHSTKQPNDDLGWYPDALLPFDKAIEYGENKISAGENQSIWFTIKTACDLVAGEYTGAVTLIIDGESMQIPLIVTVWDYLVPQETHVKTDLVIGSNGLMHGEGDYTPQMYRKYVERVIEYRCGPHRLIQDMNPSYVEGADFVKAVRELTTPDKPYLSTIMLPVYAYYDGINEPLYFRYLDALADACIEDNINYLERAAVYCGFIDEPHNWGNWDQVNRVCRRFEELKKIAAEKFVDRTKESALRDEVVKSILQLGNFVTAYFDERLTDVVNWCPEFFNFTTADKRASYMKEGNTIWWYGCGSGENMPSYAIDHVLLDARVMNWMQFDYGFTGSLYWEAVMYYKWVWCQESHVNLVYNIDCYKEAFRCAKNAGDGFLFYPGKPYGIDGPVDSIRLQMIRDGIEDYETLWYLEKLYNEAGKSAKTLLRPVYDSLYQDVALKASADEFDVARERVAELILKAQKGIFEEA